MSGGFTSKHTTIWSDEKVEKLIALHAKELSARAMAEVLCVTRNTVIGKLFRLKAQGIIARSPGISAPKKYVRPVKPLARPRVPMQVKPKAVVYPIPTKTNSAKLVDIKKNQCRYIEADVIPGDGDLQYMCGDKVWQEGAAYCGHHHKVCHYPDTAAEYAKRNKGLMRSLRRFL